MNRIEKLRRKGTRGNQETKEGGKGEWKDGRDRDRETQREIERDRERERKKEINKRANKRAMEVSVSTYGHHHHFCQ